MASKSKRYCSVPQCNNYKSENISIHAFPKDPVLLKKWATVLRFGKRITKGMSVCSDHFVPSDFHPLRAYSTKRYLKIGVVPSQKIPVRKYDKPEPSTSSSSRMSRVQRRCGKRELLTKITEHMDVEDNDTTDAEETAELINASLDQQNTATTQEKILVDTCVQVNLLTSKLENRCHEYLLTSSKKISVYAGINLEIFHLVTNLVRNTLKLFPKLNTDNIQKKICLILTKLKLDLSFRALAILYEVSTTTAQNYFNDYIQVLYLALKPAIYFPTKEENMCNMPKCFSKYRKVRIIIDATEVSVQRTVCLDCRIRTYSHYKKTHTAKYLISISPAGLIMHVSSAYAGHVSDKAIFNEEKIIDLLEPYHDEIMVDKGVLIENECAEVGIKLVRPPFLRKKKKFSKEEALQTASIARARVHVERSIQRIKIYKIFANKLQWSLVPYLSEMMTVICALVNLSRPILSDDKFIM